jgi:DNA-directed RNA polymerase specialized sigma24 family protein
MSWQEFEPETTADLIEYIRWKEKPEHMAVAEDAMTAFIFRFRKDLQHKCKIIAKRWGYDDDVGNDIAERAFNRFWLYGSRTFNASKCNTNDFDACVRLYLYRIAERELTNHKAEELDTNPYTGEEEIIREFPKLDNIQMTVEKKAELKKRQETIEKALERLTHKHKTIYLTYKAHRHEGHTLPRGLLKKLRTELELTQSSIQVYNKEALDTIDEFIKIYG